MKIEYIKAKAMGEKLPFDLKSEIWNWVRSIAAAIILTLLLVNFVFVFVRVDGESMTNTLQNGDRLFVDRLAYVFSEPRRGDIVILHYPVLDPEKVYVKRCIAVSGDTVEIRDGILYVNGEMFGESYTRDDIMTFSMQQVVVPEGHVFVMGDNRNDSFDSTEIGPVSIDKLLGKACFVVWPFDRIEYIA